MKCFIFILTLLTTIGCYGQNNSNEDKGKRLTVTEIRRQFPFNKTETIKLVSFKYDYQETTASDTTLTEIPIYAPEIPKTNGQVDMTKMFEVKTLNDKQEDKLLNILMNTKPPKTSEVVFCYEPRNGIVLFDKDEQILAYIEICFECLKYKVDPETIKIPTLYKNGLDTLKRLFSDTGITYGTKENEDK